ncbi:MAG: hypothetical protein J5663_12455 [Bacteroidaceae bacterium]|nr:hypothetical protein [Bacteroidaceae bacterium]
MALTKLSRTYCINRTSAMGAVVGKLMTDLRQIIDEARIHVASTANYELTMMYWHIGERINRDVLGNERACIRKADCRDSVTTITNMVWWQGF